MLASVIIPAYNSSGTISACISSLKAQKGVAKKSYEIIVVDDGSSDDTATRAKKLGSRVVHQENSGPAKARNFGARFANGKILVFTDADCIPEKEWLAEMLKPFADKRVAGVQGTYRTMQTSLTARFVQAEIEERYERMKANSERLDWIGSYSAAYRARDFFEAGGFDESFPKASGEDPELSYKLAKSGKKLVFNPKAVVYHSHPDTIAKYFWVKFYRAFYRVTLYSKHSDKIVHDSYTPNSIKAQIIAGYFGTAMVGLVPVLYFLDQPELAAILLVANVVIGIVATLTILRSFHFVLQKNLTVAVFALFMIQVRTAAFMLGLPAGVLGRLHWLERDAK